MSHQERDFYISSLFNIFLNSHRSLRLTALSSCFSPLEAPLGRVNHHTAVTRDVHKKIPLKIFIEKNQVSSAMTRPFLKSHVTSTRTRAGIYTLFFSFLTSHGSRFHVSVGIPEGGRRKFFRTDRSPQTIGQMRGDLHRFSLSLVTNKWSRWLRDGNTPSGATKSSGIDVRFELNDLKDCYSVRWRF